MMIQSWYLLNINYALGTMTNHLQTSAHSGLMMSLGIRNNYDTHFTDSETDGQSNLLRATQLARIEPES